MTTPLVTGSSPGEIPRSALDVDSDRHAHRPRNWFWIFVGWSALLTVLAVLVLRWQEPERPAVIALVGLTPMFAGPLLIGLLGSWWSRSLTLRVFGAAVAATFLFTTSPADALIGCGGESAPDAITIYSANVLAGGGRPADIATSILESDADVVMMQEVEWPFLRELSADPRLSDYEHWSHHIEGRSLGRPVWSRWPIIDVDVEWFVRAQLVHVTIAGPTGDFTVTNVHTSAPSRLDNVEAWHAQFDQLQQIDQTEPRLVGGDFNATQDHQPFRQLLDSGWTDVQEEKGCGFDATWPTQRRLPFAVYRLDHVLVTDHFEVLDVRFGDPGGSDHKPVITSLRLT